MLHGGSLIPHTAHHQMFCLVFSYAHNTWRQRNGFTRDMTCAVCLFSILNYTTMSPLCAGRPLFNVKCDKQWNNISGRHGNDVVKSSVSFGPTICPRWWRRQDWGGNTSSAISVSSSREQDNRRRMILQAPLQKQQGPWRAHRARRQLTALNWEMVSRCLKGSISSQLVQGEKESHSCPPDNQIHSQDIDSSTSLATMSLLYHSDGLHQQEKPMTTITCHMTLIIAP